jgi:Ca-activated chloride channel homolog
MRTIKEILIDLSGSMGNTLPGNIRKIDLAKDILIDKIFPYISSADTVGIRVFGGQCDMVGHLENIPNANFKKLREFVLNQLPEPNGSTPLALAIKTAVNNLIREPNTHKEIYLVTDGEETCGGDVKDAADYAARNDVKCVINIIAIGELKEKAKEQFAYITHVTGGKNINIGTKSTSPATIDRELSLLLETGIDSISDLIDKEYTGKKEALRVQEIFTIKDFLMRKNSPINYIPSDQGATCQKLLVIEFYDDDNGLANLIRGLEHVEMCSTINKEVLILMKSWDASYHPRFFKPWNDRFKDKGIERVCIKIGGFRSYMEL